MAKPSFHEQLSQLLALFTQQSKQKDQTVENFAAFLAASTESKE